MFITDGDYEEASGNMRLKQMVVVIQVWSQPIPVASGHKNSFIIQGLCDIPSKLHHVQSRHSQLTCTHAQRNYCWQLSGPVKIHQGFLFHDCLKVNTHTHTLTHTL